MAAPIQAPDPGTQRAGGIAGLFGKRVARARGPSVEAYTEERNRAQGASEGYANSGAYYQGRSQDYTQQIDNKFQDQSRGGIGQNVGAQQTLANNLANNQGEASKAQFQSGLDQGIAAQMSVANSTTGGAVAQAGAARGAGQQAAMMRAGGAATAAQLGAQERLAAQGQAAGVYNNIGGQLQNQYGLEQESAIQNQAQQNQMRQGYGQLGVQYGQLRNQANGQSMDALNSFTSAGQSAQGMSAGMKAQDAADTNNTIGTVAGATGDAAKTVGSMLADGGAMGQAPNSIAQVYAPGTPERRQHTASLAEALAGIDALRAQLEGRARADGGSMTSPAYQPPNTISAEEKWERSFGSADKARDDVRASDNRAEAAKIREHFAPGADGPKKPSLVSTLGGFSSGVGRRVNGGQGGGSHEPDWSAYMRPRPIGARAFGGAMGEDDGMSDANFANPMQTAAPVPINIRAWKEDAEKKKLAMAAMVGVSPDKVRAFGGAMGGGVDMGNEGGMTGDMVNAASTGRAGNFAGKELGMVGGGGITGGGNTPGGAGGGGGGMAPSFGGRIANALKGLR